ncbi:MAG: TonB family protein [Dysgonamonadaceae bacterium]|nr:TonB family protein [Dysgonamonadaceae bacterium]
MEPKKTPQADLENERATFFLLGFTLVLSTFFVLLEWSSEDALPPVWEGLPAVVIENEYGYDDGFLLAPAEPELTGELPEEKAPEVVYEDYNIVEEVPAETLLESQPETSVVEASVPEHPSQEMPVIEPLVTEADVMPQYPGGYAAMNRYLFNNLKYPASALSQRIEGRVWCSFMVNKDGSLSNIQVEKSVYISLDQEALRVLQTMPAWIPGRVGGNLVCIKIYLPIVFKL